MASAVDSRRSAASPSASPAKSRRSGGSSSPPSNPVALEVPVIATGARPGDSDSQRELFTEETNTVLVFENGAVIRLSSAVAAGQLLFLTHKESRREVVAQVVGKRDFRPTSCYVEVEFSEPAPGFWGVEFAQNEELVPANPQQEAAAELVHSARAISGKSSAAAPAPSAKEVDALKEEVEALRKQLMSLQSQASAGKVTVPTPTTPPLTATPIPASAATQVSPPLGPSPTPPDAAAEVPKIPFSTAGHVSPLPPAERGDTASVEDQPFPRPEIRINRKTASASRAVNPRPVARGSFRPGVLRFALLAATFLLAATGAAWYLHWIPGLSPLKKPSSSPAPISPGYSAAQPAAALPSAPQPSPVEASRPSAQAPRESQPAISAVAVAPRDQQKSPMTPAAIKRAVPHPSSQESSASVVPFSQTSGFVPPKLLKSVRAVASPAALQYFDKGNTVIVTLDAFVDASGQVKAMKVVSGPASLHRAAMTALGQYQYAPARQSGKPVGAHVTVPIKFLFEP